MSINKLPICRGRKTPLTRFEMRFWDRFPELLMDDPDEDEHNELIGILRNMATKYYKENKQ